MLSPCFVFPFSPSPRQLIDSCLGGISYGNTRVTYAYVSGTKTKKLRADFLEGNELTE